MTSITLGIRHRLPSTADKVPHDLHCPLCPQLPSHLCGAHSTNMAALLFLQLELFLPPLHPHYLGATAFSFFIAFNILWHYIYRCLLRFVRRIAFLSP